MMRSSLVYYLNMMFLEKGGVKNLLPLGLLLLLRRPVSSRQNLSFAILVDVQVFIVGRHGAGDSREQGRIVHLLPDKNLNTESRNKVWYRNPSAAPGAWLSLISQPFPTSFLRPTNLCKAVPISHGRSEREKTRSIERAKPVHSQVSAHMVHALAKSSLSHGRALVERVSDGASSDYFFLCTKSYLAINRFDDMRA